MCRFIAGQLVEAYTRAPPLPNSVRFTKPTVPVWFTVCRSTLIQATQPRKGFHSNKRKCFSQELKAEIINQVDMKRKTKAQICRDSKILPGLLYTFLKDRSHQTQSKDPWVPFTLLRPFLGRTVTTHPPTHTHTPWISIARTCLKRDFSSGTKSPAIAMHYCTIIRTNFIDLKSRDN